MENMDNNQPQNNTSQEGMGKKKSGHTGLFMAIALIVVLGVIVFFNKPKDSSDNIQQAAEQEQQKQDNTSPASTPTPVSEQTIEEPQTSSSEVKTFTVNGNNFSFSLKEIKVKKGDRVKIVFNNTAGFHDWVIDEFNAKTPQIQAGESATVEFVADKSGIFEYYCSVGQHRANGMVGNLIVE